MDQNIKCSFETCQIEAALIELRRIGSERLSLEQSLLPGESPTTSPDMSPGSTEGDLTAPPPPPAAPAQSATRVLIDQVLSISFIIIFICKRGKTELKFHPSDLQVDRELRQCGGHNGRGRLASVHPPLFPRLDAAMKSLGSLRSAKRREDELLRRLRVVGQGSSFT